RGAALGKGLIFSIVANKVDDMFRLDKGVKLKSISVYEGGTFSGVLRCSLGAASYKKFDTSSTTEGDSHSVLEDLVREEGAEVA
ncbi:hypothetical protein HHI36_001721, partial [Cryptolaemus montrouzieri]